MMQKFDDVVIFWPYPKENMDLHWRGQKNNMMLKNNIMSKTVV